MFYSSFPGGGGGEFGGGGAGDYWQPPEEQKSRLTGSVTAQEEEKTSDKISVKCKIPDYVCCWIETKNEFGDEEVTLSIIGWATKDECAEKGGKEIQPNEDGSCGGKNNKKPYTQNEIVCDVKNFQLPQEVSKAEEWIPYYGDPKFLVYWQKFPIEEDTWTFKDSWKTYAAIIAISAIPLPSWGKITLKGATRKLEQVVKKYAEKAATEGVKREIRSIQKQALKEMLEAWKRHIKEKGIFKSGGKILLGSGTLMVADLIESWGAKFEEHPNKILLKVAGEKRPEEFDVQLKKSVPLFVAFKKEMLDFLFGEKARTLHFVSPCYLKNMEVYKIDVGCEEYVYNSESNTVVCRGPDIKNTENLPLCQRVNYLRKGGVANAPKAEDPVIDYVEGFARGDVPEYVEITEDTTTVVLADGVVMRFDINSPLADGKEARIVVDTGKETKEIHVTKADDCIIMPVIPLIRPTDIICARTRSRMQKRA